MNARRQWRSLQVSLLRRYSRVVQRPWGLLVYNIDNPHFYEANGARHVNAEVPGPVIDEIISFYRQRRLVPRVLVDQDSRPEDLAAQLERRGFVCGRSHFHLMRWMGQGRPAPRLPLDVQVSVAERRDLPYLVSLQKADDVWSRSDWLRSRTLALLAARSVRIYVLWVGTVPVSMGLLAAGDEACLIEGVTTHPAYRRQGFASTLIAHLQHDTDGPLLLAVQNEALIRLYRKLGFTVVEECAVSQCWLPEG